MFVGGEVSATPNPHGHRNGRGRGGALADVAAPVYRAKDLTHATCRPSMRVYGGWLQCECSWAGTPRKFNSNVRP